MSLLKMRTWAVLATVLAVGSPVLAAGKGQVDRQLQALQQHGPPTVPRLRLIVQPDGTVPNSTLLQTLRSHSGVRILRQHSRIGRFTIEIAGKDLAWAEGLRGFRNFSIDAP